MAKQLQIDLGQQFNPVRTHKSGPYRLTYQVGDKQGNVTHVTAPDDVVDTIDLGKAPAKALKDWHLRTMENYR